MKKIAYLAGMPRSGSTLLSNILAMHPKIYSTPSSPLCSIIQGMRRQWSDDAFLLAQLDKDFDKVNRRLKRSTISFMQGWVDETDKPVVLDKNRGWLMLLDTLNELDPDYKMIVTLRDLRKIYSSVEKRHRKTMFLEFPDHMEHNLVDVRANHLFGDGGVIGSVLKGLQNIGDIPDAARHLYYWRYEDFMNNPQQTTNGLFEFLGVDPVDIDFENIQQSTNESDSHYRMKYPHNIKNSIVIPDNVPVSPRILNEITTRYRWYYDTYYPDVVAAESAPIIPMTPIRREFDAIEREEVVEINRIEPNPQALSEADMARKIEIAIQDEIAK